VHGGGFDSRCWDLLVPHLAAPSLAVDLPGRGRRPARFRDLSLADSVQAIVDDAEAAGFTEVVLVGHSFAGAVLPGAMAKLADRLHHVVFVAATVPADGLPAASEVPAETVAAVSEHRQATSSGTTMDRGMARVAFGNDLDDDQFEWCYERMVPEALRLTLEPVDLSGLQVPVERSWIRPTLDALNSLERQARTAARVGASAVHDLEAGHMCMIGQPERLAGLLNSIAGP
jgi:pimeloyl-ACP methyl ester carboxylesterase